MKVFLSSTAQDLSEYRRVADDTIRRLQINTAAIELFGPLPGTPVAETERFARESDVVICIVAHRYGYIPEKGRGSITRREVEAAHSAGRDILVWIVADDYPWTEKREQDLLADPNVLANPERVAEVAAAVSGLLDFKTWLRKTFTPETFTTPDDLGRKISVALANYARGRTQPEVLQANISISRLPLTGTELFGRESELQLLDDAWNNPNTNVLSLISWGGVGKTALVNHWLKRRMARDNYRGAERIFAWSFFSQTNREGAASADLFIDHALRWFNDSDPTVGSPWDKGNRLARYVRQARTLLILDGLEPLQYPPGPQDGRLKDAAMHALLLELAAQQPGLCVITSRQRLGDLVEFENGTVVQYDLNQLSPPAGTQLLRSLNVKGDNDELEQAVREQAGHAFSLTLLGSYLDEVLSGDIRRRREIENLFADSRFGGAARGMIAAYETWLGEGIEVAILRLLGLFDRPADSASITVLRQSPVISGLTESLQNIKDREWNQAISKLRRMKLLGEPDPGPSGALDAHPLVREHFKQQLKTNQTEAWREANNRLYEHLKDSTKQLPDTIDEMSPLLSAVGHGCAAGRHQEVLDDVYLTRVRRGRENYIASRLGAFGADLAALTNFFETYWEQPCTSLSAAAKSFVLSEAGFDLRALGRLQEAIQPMEAGLYMDISRQVWTNAAISAGNLSALFTLVGDLDGALEWAEKSVEFADQSGKEFQRINKLTRLADVLHKIGDRQEALGIFRDAEAMQKQWRPHNPLLYSLGGFYYCDLLLAQGEVQEVKERASTLLERSSNSSIDIALYMLLLGRAWLFEVEGAGYSTPGNWLMIAVDRLRQAGTMDLLPEGLLARAAFYRFLENFEKADGDLAEVNSIATRSGMGLYLADYHLESARLRLAEKKNEPAREHFETARKMIRELQYYKREEDLHKLEAQLG